MPRFTFADGRPNVAAPPRRAVVRAGPTSSFQQLRELTERHMREDAALRRAWRPPVLHACPTSTPRPREGGARVLVASGRDGSEGRDDGDGGGSDPPPHLKFPPRSRAPRVLKNGRARQ